MAKSKVSKAVKASVATPVAPTNLKRYNNGTIVYPLPDDLLVLVGGQPAKGANQRYQWQQCVAAQAAAKKAKVPFTAGYLAASSPVGRRTLRRAMRMGAFKGLGPNAKA